MTEDSEDEQKGNKLNPKKSSILTILKSINNTIDKMNPHVKPMGELTNSLKNISIFVVTLVGVVLGFIAIVIPLNKQSYDDLQESVNKDCIAKNGQNDRCTCLVSTIPKVTDPKLYDAILFVMQSSGNKDKSMEKLRGKYNLSQSEADNYYRSMGSNMEAIKGTIREAAARCGIKGYKP